MILTWLAATASAQNFLAPVEVAWGMEAYAVTLDRTRYTGSVRSPVFRFGELYKLTLKEPDGTKHKLKAVDIVELGVAATDGVARANVDSMMDLIGGGRAAFVPPEWVVFDRLALGDSEALLQRLNPGFDHLLRVYPDPAERSTASVGLLGMVVAGGGASAYWVVRDGEHMPIEITRKRYDEQWAELFGACPAMLRPTSPKLSDFAEHVYDFDQRCAVSTSPPPGPVDSLPLTVPPAE